MSKAIRLRDQNQNAVAKLLDSLCGRYSRWEVWQDFIIMSAISIANVMGGPHRENREKQYRDRAQKYSGKELEIFADMLAKVVYAMEQNPDQDFLGELFMALDLGNEWKGQFFTPYNGCLSVIQPAGPEHCCLPLQTSADAREMKSTTRHLCCSWLRTSTTWLG